MTKKSRTDISDRSDYSTDYDKDSLYDLDSSGEDNLYTLPDDVQDDDYAPFQSYQIEDDSENVEESEGTERLDEKDRKGQVETEDSEEDEEDDEADEIEEEEEEADEDDEKGNVLLLLIKMLSTPVEGWKELKRRGYSPDEIGAGCFFPLLLIAAVSDFAPKMYGRYITATDCIMQALVTFISFFFGYFSVTLIGRFLLPNGARDIFKNNFGREFVMMNISSLALFYTVLRLLPMLDAVLVFLPIWTVYLIYKGVRFLRVPARIETRTKIILTFLILGMPYLWTVLLEIFFNL